MSETTHLAFPDVKFALEGTIARVGIDRGPVRNALRTETALGLAAAITYAGTLPGVRLLWLTGEGGSFCAGADLADASAFSAPGDRRENARHHIESVFHPIVKAIMAFPHPTLAVIPGAAVGFGFDITLACDLRIAASQAKLGPIFNHIGLIPDGGGTWSLQRLVGTTRALEWILTGKTHTAAEVADWGLLNRVVPTDELETAARGLAESLVKGPPMALAAARRLIYEAHTRTFDEALAAERDAQVGMLMSRDFGEGVAAWFERRKPAFTGE